MEQFAHTHAEEEAVYHSDAGEFPVSEEGFDFGVEILFMDDGAVNEVLAESAVIRGVDFGEEAIEESLEPFGVEFIGVEDLQDFFADDAPGCFMVH